MLASQRSRLGPIPASGRYRHDLPEYNSDYGLSYKANMQDNMKIFDKDRTESFNLGDVMGSYAETTCWASLTYRFEASNIR